MKTLFERAWAFFAIAFVVLSAVLGVFASKILINSDFKKLLPLEHPYLVNMMEHQDDLTLGNEIRIVVESGEQTVDSKEYLAWIQKLTNRIYELPGVDKTFIKTLWTPNARWIAVTEDGFQGGEIIPANYDGSDESLAQVRENILRSSELGRLVADNFRSSTLFVPLVWGESIDYSGLNQSLEQMRAESRKQGFDLRVIGVAKKIGDLIVGAEQMAVFFIAAVALIFFALFFYTSSWQVAGILSISGLLGVVWQLGLISMLGPFFNMGLDPYSMLVPFLVFAIAISHGLQLYSCAGGLEGDNIGRRSFGLLWKPASLALASDALGFATLAIIPIAAIRDLAFAASLGVLCLFVTTLLFIPLMIQRFGVSRAFKDKLKARAETTPWWVSFCVWGSGSGRWYVFGALLAIGLAGGWVSRDLQIGDLRAGAPELRPESQYNQDVQFFVDNYSQSVDVYVVLVRTAENNCNAPSTLRVIDELQYRLGELPSVQNSFSLVDGVKAVQQGLNEGFPKWRHIPSDGVAINGTTGNLPSGFINLDCSFTPIYVFLDDHKAQTLADVTAIVEDFNLQLQNRGAAIQTLPAAGNAGIEAAVNQSIDRQQKLMLVIIYLVVFVLCLLTFRRFKLVFAIMLPLAMTSLLCQALMTLLGIGVKVSTLPVIALGVGIGVDYGVYICASYLLNGNFSQTFLQTGRIVAFTGITLAVSVGTWVFSAIQFQADMGALLTFMFLWNMVGALLFLPALLGLFSKGEQIKL